MSFSFTPHWAFPTLFVLFAGLCVSVFSTGCVANVDGLSDDVSAATTKTEVCGGAVCLSPTDVSVRHWGDGELTVVAFHTEPASCAVPRIATTEHAGIAGTAIELRLHGAKPGAHLPLVTRQRALDEDAGWVTARAIRVNSNDGRALADEETVSGEATILDLDEQTGRVRVRLNGKWSSGVSSELLIDVPGPHACPAGI